MKKFIFGLVATILISPVFAVAADLHAGERYSLSAKQVAEGNIYVAAGDTVISGEVGGDLMGVSGNFLITSDISDDVTVASGNVSVTGEVGGDLRVAAGTLTITGDVGGDVAGFVGQTNIADGSVISGDVLVAGGVLFIDGEVRGDVKIAGGEVIIGGTVFGSVNTQSEKLTLLDGAEVKGDVNHSGVKEPEIGEEAVIGGEVNFTQKSVVAGKTLKKRVLFSFGLFKLILSLTGALVIFWIFRSKLDALVKRSVSSCGAELLRGFIVAILLPIVGVILLATVIGLPLGIALIFLYALMLIISCILSGVVFGAWAAKVLKKPIKKVDWRVVLGGVIVLHALTLIPFVGWLIGLVFTLLTFGSLSWHLYKAVK